MKSTEAHIPGSGEFHSSGCRATTCGATSWRRCGPLASPVSLYSTGLSLVGAWGLHFTAYAGRHAARMLTSWASTVIARPSVQSREFTRRLRAGCRRRREPLMTNPDTSFSDRARAYRRSSAHTSSPSGTGSSSVPSENGTNNGNASAALYEALGRQARRTASLSRCGNNNVTFNSGNQPRSTSPAPTRTRRAFNAATDSLETAYPDISL